MLWLTGMDISAAIWLAVRDFMERGGGVLLLLMLIILLMWTLILSRWLYLKKEYRNEIEPILAAWIRRRENDRDALLTDRLKHQSLAFADSRLRYGIATIRTLAAVCPLLGLLGTVVGMVMVFEILGQTGHSSPRVVAGGVSTAMVTTMAGMVGALSGILPASALARRVRKHMSDLQSADTTGTASSRNAAQHRSMRIRRYALAPLGACLVTFSLAFAMEQMIQIGNSAVAGEGLNYRVDFIRIARDEAIETRKKPEKPPEVEFMPDMPEPVTGNVQNVVNIAFQPPPTTMNSGSGFGISSGFALANSDGDYLPIVKPQPVYPYRALRTGLEGIVILQYTVTTEGTTRDVFVVESTDDMFNAPAIEAARQYRYTPRIVNGIAVEVVGVRTRMYFELED